MICVAVQSNIIKPDRGISGVIPYCYANLSGFFYGDVTMKCGHETCPLLTISLIPLTQGKYAIVDTEDYDYLMQWKWYTASSPHTYYARRNIPIPATDTLPYKQKIIAMHQVVVINPLHVEHFDHKNHYGLDNRKSNVRPCSCSENQHNQRRRSGGASKYKGVFRISEAAGNKRKKWQAIIRHNKRNIYLGYYYTEQQAAKAYDEAAIRLFGEFAYTNDMCDRELVGELTI